MPVDYSFKIQLPRKHRNKINGIARTQDLHDGGVNILFTEIWGFYFENLFNDGTIYIDTVCYSSMIKYV